MYPLGKQFTIDQAKLVSNNDAIIKGQNFRITILTERLVRLEYSKTGNFINYQTQLVTNRLFDLAKFNKKEDDRFLEITTKYFKLEYVKEAHFDGGKFDPLKNLKITLNDTEKVWYYNHPEVRNYKGNHKSIDLENGESLKGIYSLDGFASIDDSHSKIILEDGTIGEREFQNDIDIYVFLYKNDFSLALKDYFHLTGKPSLIPRYALGIWWSRDKSYSDKDVLDVVNQFENNSIPLSVFLLDNDWHVTKADEKENLKTGYTFNNKLFPNPSNLINTLHKKNIRVGLNINPKEGIYPHEIYYQQACNYLNVYDNKILLFDPLNPKFLDVYMKLFLHPLENLGIDFFWNDYNTKNDLQSWANNHYTYLDASRNDGKRPMILSRNSYIAPHRYSILYPGKSEVSWASLRQVPFWNLNASNIGVSWWSHDIGGNHGGIEESELYIRFVELGVFSPILRFSSAPGAYYKKEPWLWDIKTLTVVREYLTLRHKLIPYLYTEAYRYYEQGIPLIKPFYYDYSWTYDDDNYRNQYYFGNQLLVSPILERMDPVMNRTIHKFYIPEGVWYDFKTGKKFPGAKKYISFFKEEDYPVFAKSGSIIPLSLDKENNNISNPKNLEINIFPGKNNTYTLYEDDGFTSLYKEGFFLKTEIDYNYLKNNYTLIIRSIEGKSGIVNETRNYKIRFRNTKHAEDVTTYFNDQLIETTNYTLNNDFVVEVKSVPTVGQLTINCKGKDIEIDAVRLINEDIDSILMDLQINAYLKEKLADVLFSDLPIKKKRISVRKLQREGLSKFI